MTKSGTSGGDGLAGEPPGRSTTGSIACMRCGHDLRAAPSQWATACPVHGTCVECGLDFAWGELLSPRLRTPAWNLETRVRRRWWPTRCLLHTFMVLFRPRRVFESLSMVHPVRWGRLVPALLPGVLVIAAVSVFPVARDQWRAGMPLRTVLASAAQPWSNTPTVATTPYRMFGSSRATPAGYVDVVSASNTFHVGPMLRSDFPADLGVPQDPVDVLNGEPLRAIPLTPGSPGTPRSNRFSQLSFHHMQGANGPVLVWSNGTLTPAELRGLLTPISFPVQGPRPVRSVGQFVRSASLITLPLLLIPFAAAAVFLLLPDTRRGGRVHVRHVFRLLVYGILAVMPVAIFVPLGLMLLGRSSNLLTWTNAMLVGRKPPSEWAILASVCVPVLVAMGILWAWTGRWCVMAARYHLRLGPARAVGLTVAFIASLACVVAGTIGMVDRVW